MKKVNMEKLNRSFVPMAVAIFFVFVLFGFVGQNTALAATSPTLSGSNSYSVLAGTTVTNAGSTVTNGAVGVSPGTAITGFPPGIAGGGTHSDDASAIAAQTDNLVVFGTLDQSCDQTFGAVDLTATFPAGVGPGVYCSTSSFSLSGNLNLTGSGVWIFKSVSTLITSPGSSVTGGDPCNVWWRVGSSATLDTTTSFIGNIFALTSITFNTGATLNGRALAQNGAVTLDGNTISGPTCSTVPAATPTSGRRPDGTINVIKTVINDNGGTKTVADFSLFVDGKLVPSGATYSFRPALSYEVTESADPKYTRTFSGDCDSNGHLDLDADEAKFCIITNDDIGTPLVVPPVPPLIDVVKVPSPLALPAGPGPVTYTYTLRNIGTVPVTNVTMVGDTCSPIILASGDTNGDAKLDVDEAWVYRCSTTLSETHTNTVVATGWANGISATDIASATVVVGVPIVPPLIHVTKIPDPLVLLAGGGMVTYTESISNPGTVALSNVSLNDDKCSPLEFISGDTNEDTKLAPTETWIYTCKTNLTKTTTNTAVASGEANGLTVRDFAIVTVVVAAPGFPKAGTAPYEKNIPWNSIMLVGVLLVAPTLGVVGLKKLRTS